MATFVADLSVIAGAEASSMRLESAPYEKAAMSAIHRLRAKVYESKGASYLCAVDGEAMLKNLALDERSFHLTVHRHAELIGALRLTVAPFELSRETGRQEIDHDYADHVEFGRLVMTRDASYRVSAEKLMAAGCLLALQKNKVGIVAMCRPVQARLFERYGLRRIIPSPITLPQRHNGSYWLLASTWQSMAEPIARIAERIRNPLNAFTPTVSPDLKGHRMNREKDLLDFPAFFSKLDQRLDILWGDLIRTSPLLRVIDENRITRELYAIYMVETYHYTGHNARNQALVGMRPDLSAPYMKFCLEHAADEVGHEKMALHDVASLGIVDPDAALPVPLMETDILISYLYWVSQTGNPLQRLGYSYWAESCYKYINPLLAKLRKHLDLQASQMTFFIAHSDIDAEHFEDIKRIIERTCKSQEDLDAVTRVMESTLKLTGDVLNACHREYELHLAGLSKRCVFLGSLVVS